MKRNLSRIQRIEKTLSMRNHAFKGYNIEINRTDEEIEHILKLLCQVGVINENSKGNLYNIYEILSATPEGRQFMENAKNNKMM